MIRKKFTIIYVTKQMCTDSDSQDMPALPSGEITPEIFEAALRAGQLAVQSLREESGEIAGYVLEPALRDFLEAAIQVLHSSRSPTL